jgi:proton glutamate symport protein
MSTNTPAKPRFKLTLTHQIFLGLAVGIAVGAVVHDTNPDNAHVIKPFGDLFLRMIKMIIAPLIFSTLVSGIAGVGHPKAVGRMGFRALVYFEVVTTLALIIGLVVVHVTKPGVGVSLPSAAADAVQAVKPQTWDQVLLHTFPTSVVQAMAEGEILQIVVFSIIFALAMGLIGEKAKPIIELCESISLTMFKFTNIVMYYAPIGVGAAIAYVVAKSGFGVLKNLAALVGTLYLALAILIFGVMLPAALLFRVPIRKFVASIKEPVLIAFSTSVSEAALPKAMVALERLGVPRSVVSFVLPLGYSFNLDGSTLYLSLASIFVAQAANVDLTVGEQITMLLTLMLTSKGVAAVPRATLVIIAGTLASYNLPLEGITLILGVDAVMDMARTATNVIGNCLATVVVSKWEGNFQEASMEDILNPAPEVALSSAESHASEIAITQSGHVRA